MNAVDRMSGPLDLSTLPEPACLREPARLYVVTRDAAGQVGTRRFVASLPAGAAVTRLAEPEVAFLLVAGAVGTRAPTLSTQVVTAEAMRAWRDALEGAGTGASPPADVRRMAPDAARWTDEALDPALADAEPQRRAHALARWHLALVRAEAAEHTDRMLLDEGGFRRSLRIIRASIDGRAAPGGGGHVRLAEAVDAALLAAAQAEGIVLRRVRPRPRDGDWRRHLAELSLTGNFRTRTVRLTGRWWLDEGPALIAEDRTTGEPVALLPSRSGYRRAAPETRIRRLTPAEASCFAPDAVMLYPSLPEQPKGRDILRFACKGSGRDLWRLALTTLLAAVFGMFIPVATGALIGTAVPLGRTDLVLELLVGLTAAAIAGAAFWGGRRAALMRTLTRVDWRLQAALWDRVLRLPAGFFRDYTVGDLTSRIQAIDDIRRTLSWTVATALWAGMLSVVSLALMLVYDLRLGLVACAYGLAVGAVLFLIKLNREKLLRDQTRGAGLVNGLVLELLDGVRKIRVAAAEQRVFARFVAASVLLWTSRRTDSRMVNLQILVSENAPMLGLLAAFSVAANGPAAIDVTTFSAFCAAFGQFTASIWSLADALAVSTIVVPMARRLEPLLETPVEVEEARADPGVLGGQIAMRSVGFRYREDGPWILRDIDLDIAPGSFVAIVGPSGSGKSTLLRLLLGFDTAETGSVFYDGRDLAKLDLRLLRRQIGTVLQSTGLVPGTIRENIAGSAIVADEQVMKAALMAGLGDDLAAMPAGLDTVVSEGGASLSGGQRQRVMIARALVRDPRILFFDEATSALDNRTQAIVSESLGRLSATRVVIAHRLSTIRNADLILVVEGGRIVERGDFATLMAAQGAFHRLAHRQLV